MIPVRTKFTGKERDAETGLDYFGARYMSAAQGRFTSPDQPFIDQNEIDPQSWNLYSYVRNNPLRFLDPNGQICMAPEGKARYDDTTIPGQSCAEVDEANKTKKPDITIVESFRYGGGAIFGPVGFIGTYPPTSQQTAIQDDIGTLINAAPLGSAAKGLPVLGMAVGRFALRGLLVKAAAREAVEAMGLPAVQAAAAKSAIARATATSTVKVTQSGSDVLVEIFREGANGFQVIETRIGVFGNKTVVQKAYDAAGKLVHFDPK